MTIQALEQTIRSGERLLVDTTTLIAYLNGGEDVTPFAEPIVNQLVHDGRNNAVVSMASVMEVLVRPLRLGATGPYRHVLDFLTRFPNLDPIPVDLAVAQEAASLRAAFRLSAPDALIVATGIVAQVRYLVTNDAEWSRKLQPLQSRIVVCRLGSLL